MSEAIIKLLLAAVFGLVLGIEREAKHKPLGLKTCVVIAVTSCLLTIISIESALHYYDNPFVRADPMRLSAQIISGVGFLGAGVILRRNNDVISGLTTAAIVWSASGIGIATGAGYYKEVILGVIILFIGVRVLPFIVVKFGPRSLREQELALTIYLSQNETNMDGIFKEIKQLVGELKNVRISDTDEGLKIDFICTLKEKKVEIYHLYEKVKLIAGINQIEIQGR